MDTPTFVTFFSLAVSVGIVLLLRWTYIPNDRARGILLLSISIIWAGLTLFGDFIYAWAGNTTCSKYLGCVSGFLGYDAFEHLLFAVAAALALGWVSIRFPQYSIVQDKRWKTLLVIVAVIALISIIWEIIECAHDILRADIFHVPLRNIRLHINLLDQPSNIDTMGDLTAGLVGSIIGALLATPKDRNRYTS